MLKDIFSDLFKNAKASIKEYYKYIITIILYLLYQSNFLILLLKENGFDIYSKSKTIKMTAIYINDILYVLVLILLFRKEIINGIKEIKKNFNENVHIALKCWLVGCIIMTTTSYIVGYITKKDISGNEEIIRENIKIAPVYMLFSCSIVAPIFEELVFRRSLYGFIKKKYLFIVLSGFIFGLLHVLGTSLTPLEYLYIIPYGAMGSCFAYLLTKTKNITLPISIHMIHNTILVVTKLILK